MSELYTDYTKGVSSTQRTEIIMNNPISQLHNNIILQEFRTKFQVEENLVLNTGSWTWSVRPLQPTLGSGIISLNRYALQLSDVTVEEMSELSILVKKLETTLKLTFNYDIMNYLMLMMVDKHVHYHVIPRYNGMRNFADLEWVDNGWPSLPLLADCQHKENIRVTKKIRNTLLGNL